MPKVTKKIVMVLGTAFLCFGLGPSGAGEGPMSASPEDAARGQEESAARGQERLQAFLERAGASPLNADGLAETSDSGRAAAPVASAAPSLTVGGQIHLGTASDIFKGGSVFLWDDASNTGLGREALSANTTGVANTAGGALALFENTTGRANTASGHGALFANTTGSGNTATGLGALSSNTTGYFNTAAGYHALRSNTTASLSTAVGAFALSYSKGAFNTAVGGLALFLNTTGAVNTAVGGYALYFNKTGHHNTALGRAALQYNTSGGYNTGIGSRVLEKNTTGMLNIGVGRLAGYLNTTGSNNIWIGSHGATESNTLRIGNATGTGNLEQNRAFISGIRGITTGASDAIAVLIDSSGQLGTASSSRRHKEDIQDMAGASDRLLALRPVTFRYKREFADGEKPVQYGLIAEEVAEVFPELVVYDDQGEPETVKYHVLSTLLLNELRKLHQLNQEQEAKLDALAVLEDRVAELEPLAARLARLEALLTDSMRFTAGGRRLPPEERPGTR